MTTLAIYDKDLEGLKDQVVIITGGSSGIGLATTKRLLDIGAKLIVGDVNPPSEPTLSKVTFIHVDVTSWQEQLAMFKKAEEQYGHIDHVYANAGIRPTVTLLEDDLDESGDLAAPKLETVNINFIGALYTVKLAIHYLRKNSNGGSIVVTASTSCFMRFGLTDYTASKHGVLGLVRALHPNLYPRLPIRINAVAPSWTETGLTPPELVVMLGPACQSPDVVARSVLLLIGDKTRHGQLIYSHAGKFIEIDDGKGGLIEHSATMLGKETAELEAKIYAASLAYAEELTRKRRETG